MYITDRELPLTVYSFILPFPPTSNPKVVSTQNVLIWSSTRPQQSVSRPIHARNCRALNTFFCRSGPLVRCTDRLARVMSVFPDEKWGSLSDIYWIGGYMASSRCKFVSRLFHFLCETVCWRLSYPQTYTILLSRGTELDTNLSSMEHFCWNQLRPSSSRAAPSKLSQLGLEIQLCWIKLMFYGFRCSWWVA